MATSFNPVFERLSKIIGQKMQKYDILRFTVSNSFIILLFKCISMFNNNYLFD